MGAEQRAEIALNLACTGVGKLTLFDPDRVHPENYVRFIGGYEDLGRRKSDGDWWLCPSSFVGLAWRPAWDNAAGAAKLLVVSRALRLRRDRPDLFTGYSPLAATGPAGEHAVAYDRGGAITVATRLPVGLERAGGWRDTTLPLPAATDVLTGRSYSGDVPLAELLADYPVALLARDRCPAPRGLVLGLCRGTVLPGRSAEADRWMAMLNDRLDECVATLDRERMAVELVFRLREDGRDQLYWVTVKGTGGPGRTSRTRSTATTRPRPGRPRSRAGSRPSRRSCWPTRSGARCWPGRCGPGTGCRTR